ncbi:ABC transporter A family member 8-like isoform X1 [Panicum miliaceum]|uniref:ABC transporter A family member 8-like isoform X1 n=1 Tax=Panicum miliaceum TaxID=4540 RepID=A0A3L6T612_PANMI|nr:ABC transporter A family member 8-like isoform X1 [Panicum miliaceum]
MDSPRGPASFATQANALLRKNICVQKRNLKTNIGITFFPILICVLLIVLQNVINSELDKPKYKCGCICLETSLDGRCARKECGIQYSTLDQPFDDLPDPLCHDSWSCPASILVTGKDKAVAEAISRGLFPALSPSLNATDFLDILSKFVAGSDTQPWYIQLLEPAFFSGHTLYLIQPECLPFMSQTVSYNTGGIPFQLNIQCVEGVPLWRESASIINHEFLKGYRQRGGELNEFIAGYDFLGTTQYGLGVTVWYNSTYNDNTAYSFITTLRVPHLVNAVSNAYLKFIKGTSVEMLLEYVKDIPKVGTSFQLDLSSLLSALFFTWIIELLFPVSMMRYVDVAFCLNFFRINEYSVQAVFFFTCINLQIALAFFVSSFFSSVKMATVVGYMYVFGSGLLGAFIFRFFFEDKTFPYGWVLVMEIVPGFSLYRGLYELGQYAFSGSSMGATGMTWRSMKDPLNGMCDVLIIMSVEWALLLILAFYLDQASLLGNGVRKKHEPSLSQQDSRVVLNMEKSDVALQRKVVEQLLIDPNANKAIICDKLRKVYPGRDGNPDKLAVRGLCLVLQKGQCFGMLGPNGAGKTSFINMMIGLIRPTSGTAYVHGMDINTDMGNIYTSMGVCPQHNLLWETLTGREHLFFYGRLKNLKGAALVKAVDHSLKSVNLSHVNVGDKQVKKYSGGMKRRLSVAISLIGDPKVVFMDEPSTGLDPASRNNLWNVVKEAKRNRAIILTTHSMEEAEVLCDRLGIFVDGDFQCLGNPKELKARYGGTYIFTMTTSPDQEQEVELLVHQLSPSANKIYHLSGTQKFELPKQEVKIAHVFSAVENAKRQLTIHAWGLVDTTLEDVFIKVARGAQAFNEFA